MASHLAVSRSTVIAASRERVWKAITDEAELKKWFIQFDFSAFEVGAPFTCTAEGQTGPGVITVIEPPARFAYRWTPEKPYPDHSLVTFVLDAVEGGTRVTVTEEGFEVLPGDLGTKVMERNGGGWGQCMVNLKRFIEGDNDANSNG